MAMMRNLCLYVTNLICAVVLLNAFRKIKYAKDNNASVNRELRVRAAAYCRRVVSCACIALFVGIVLNPRYLL